MNKTTQNLLGAVLLAIAVVALFHWGAEAWADWGHVRTERLAAEKAKAEADTEEGKAAAAAEKADRAVLRLLRQQLEAQQRARQQRPAPPAAVTPTPAAP